MDDQIRHFVRQRAQHRCEYCHLPQAGHEERFSIDHIRARKHSGDDSPLNLAFSCLRCNLHKSSNLSGVDPYDGQIVPLFNPRQQPWHQHFQWNGPLLVGRTPQGRATVLVLGMNVPARVRLRQSLIAEGKTILD